jgi:hypothetical protein
MKIEKEMDVQKIAAALDLINKGIQILKEADPDVARSSFVSREIHQKLEFYYKFVAAKKLETSAQKKITEFFVLKNK